MIKLIHCADVHLDSPFTLNDPRNAELRRMELRSTFSSLVMYAKNCNAKLFLISGDLFDDEYISKDTAMMLLREMTSFPDCRFFIAPGSHDPYHTKSPYKMLKWPENVHIFKSNDLTKIEIPELNCDIYGYAFTGDTLAFNPFANKKPQNPSRINILVGHGDIFNPDSDRCPITRAHIENSGFDYLALGCIHAATGLAKAGQTYFSYPGCLESRGFDETGYKGAMSGEIGKEGCVMKGVRFSKKRYEVTRLDISSLITENQIINEIKERAAGYRDDTALLVELIGIKRPELKFNISIIEQRVPGLYFLQVRDKAKSFIDFNSLKDDKTVKGIFFRKLEEKINSEDLKEREAAKLALRYGMDVFAGLNINEI